MSARGQLRIVELTFVDGGVRYLPYGRMLAPINLWAVTQQWRTNSSGIIP